MKLVFESYQEFVNEAMCKSKSSKKSTVLKPSDINKVLKEAGLGFVTMSTGSYSRPKTHSSKSKGIRGGSVGPMTATSAWRGHNEKAEREFYYKLLKAFEKNDDVKFSVPDGNGFKMYVENPVKGIQTVYSFGWQTFPSNVASMGYDSGYQTYWLTYYINDEVIKESVNESRGFTGKEIQRKAQELLRGLGVTMPSKQLLTQTIEQIKAIIRSENIGVIFESIDTEGSVITYQEYIDMVIESTSLDISRDVMEHQMLLEFFNIGKFFRGLFINPRIKKQIRRLADDLVEIRVEQARTSLEMPEDDFEDYYSSSRSNRSNKSTKGTDKKVETLDDQAEAIEAKMDLLAANDEKLERYLQLQKIEARIRANNEIIRLADDAQTKILKRASKELVGQGRKVEKDIKNS